MKGLKQLCIVLVLLSLGEILNLRFNIPIPGTILGMVILLFLMMISVIKLKTIEHISSILLDNLALFFVPANVGIIVLYDQIKTVWVRLIIVLILSTIIVMSVTGLTVQFLDRAISKQKKGEKYERVL
ncbi:MAG: CidA/LrgA family protein [Tissierellia bacterium]|nr:CidA/LrgA family protein [Tissierellia bacterium]